MRAHLVKTMAGLIPSGAESEVWYSKIKLGSVISIDARTMRNPKFHRKYFALLNIGFDNFSPEPISSEFGTVVKNFDQFRSDVVILAGFYETWARIDGSVRIVPKSISFASMKEEAFQDLYSKTIDVLLKYVYDKSITADELDRIVNSYLNFA